MNVAAILILYISFVDKSFLNMEGENISKYINDNVNNAGQANNSSDEYEEILIFLGFPHYDNKHLFKEKTKIEIIGVETDNPTCKVYGG